MNMHPASHDPVSESPRIPRVSRNITAEERHALIAEAAYRLSEARGFVPGHEAEDWAAAEALIDRDYEGERYGGD